MNEALENCQDRVREEYDACLGNCKSGDLEDCRLACGLAHLFHLCDLENAAYKCWRVSVSDGNGEIKPVDVQQIK
tara:strand:+ start:31 stop:255 length:225 start_codon:yes stop_codon:yes gene_type:complete